MALILGAGHQASFNPLRPMYRGLILVLIFQDHQKDVLPNLPLFAALFKEPQTGPREPASFGDVPTAEAQEAVTFIVMSVCIVEEAPVPRKLPEVGAAKAGDAPAANVMCRSETATP